MYTIQLSHVDLHPGMELTHVSRIPVHNSLANVATHPEDSSDKITYIKTSKRVDQAEFKGRKLLDKEK